MSGRLLLVFALIGCGPPREIDPVLTLRGDAEAGRAQYQIVCAGCHGPEGGGIGGAPAIRETARALTDREIVEVMLHGRRGMPAKRITDAQAADVLAFVRASWGGPPAAPPATPAN